MSPCLALQIRGNGARPDGRGTKVWRYWLWIPVPTQPLTVWCCLSHLSKDLLPMQIWSLPTWKFVCKRCLVKAQPQALSQGSESNLVQLFSETSHTAFSDKPCRVPPAEDTTSQTVTPAVPTSKWEKWIIIYRNDSNTQTDRYEDSHRHANPYLLNLTLPLCSHCKVMPLVWREKKVIREGWVSYPGSQQRLEVRPWGWDRVSDCPLGRVLPKWKRNNDFAWFIRRDLQDRTKRQTVKEHVERVFSIDNGFQTGEGNQEVGFRA